MKQLSLEWWDGLSKAEQETKRNEYIGKKNHLFNIDVDVIVKIYKKLHNKIKKTRRKMFWDLDLNPIIMKRHSLNDDTKWREKQRIIKGNDLEDIYNFDFEENENENEY